MGSEIKYSKETEYIKDAMSVCTEGNNIEMCKHCDHRSSCVLVDVSPKDIAGENIRAKIRKDRYEKLCEDRKLKDKNKLQEDMWNKINEQWDDDFDIEEDVTKLTESEGMDNMMVQYQNDLIKFISGLEEKMPEWYGLDEDDKEE